MSVNRDKYSFKFVIWNVDASFIAPLPLRPGMLGSSCQVLCVVCQIQSLPLVQNDGPTYVVV